MVSAKLQRRALVLAAVTLGACEYDLDVGAAWEINQPRVLGLRMEVVEPAPIWPDRIGADPDDVPIAEALPGDRVRLVPLVVDGEGRPQAPETIEAIWFQCSERPGPGCTVEVPPCDSLEWTTDVGCEIGGGRGLEFTFPELGPVGLENRTMTVLGIIARDPTADAESCLAGFRQGTFALSACTLVEAHVLIGPRWALQHVAVEAGLEPEVPLHEIPYLALLQPANRPPAPDPPIWLDAETEAPLDGEPPRIRPGQRVRTEGPSWRSFDRQVYATADRDRDSDGYVFWGRFEGVGLLYFAHGPITPTEFDGDNLEFVVDERAPPGIVRIVGVVGDGRSDQPYGAIGMFATELEVVR